MKEEGDVFKKFRDSFSKMDGHFHILEQRFRLNFRWNISSIPNRFVKKGQNRI